MSYYCPKCGSKQNDKENHCSNCGTYLGKAFSSKTDDNDKYSQNNIKGIISSVYEILSSFIQWVKTQFDKISAKEYGQNFDYSSLSSDEKYNLFYNETEGIIKSQNKMTCIILILSVIYSILEDTIIGTICHIIIFILLLILIIFILRSGLNTISSKFINVARKLSLGILISMLLLAISFLIPPVGIILFGITIYKNWKRRAFLDKYKRYTRYVIKILLALFLPPVISKVFELISVFAFKGDMIIIPIILELLSLYIIIYGIKLYYKISLNFYKKEQARGIQFDDCTKLIWLVPFTWIMLTISFLTLIHSSSYNGDSLLANFDTDIDSYMNIDNSIPDETYSLASDLGDVNDNLQTSVINEADIHLPNSNDLSSISQDNIDTTYLSNIDQTNNQISSQESLSTFADTNTEISPLNTISNIQDTNNIPITNTSINDSNIDNTSNPSDESYKSYAIYNETGDLEEKIVQTDEHTFTIQDSQSMMEGTIHVSSITGDISLDDSLGIHQGSITNDGIIKGVDELTDGHIKTEYNGERIILDDKNQTIGHILKNGIIIDAKGMPLGNIKEC